MFGRSRRMSSGVYTREAITFSAVMLGAYRVQAVSRLSRKRFPMSRHSAAPKHRRGAENSPTPTMCAPSGARLGSHRLSTEQSTYGRLAKPPGSLTSGIAGAIVAAYRAEYPDVELVLSLGT